MKTFIKEAKKTNLSHLRHGAKELLPLHHGGDVGGGLAELPPVVRQDLRVPLQRVVDGGRPAARRASFSETTCCQTRS